MCTSTFRQGELKKTLAACFESSSLRSASVGFVHEQARSPGSLGHGRTCLQYSDSHEYHEPSAAHNVRALPFRKSGTVRISVPKNMGAPQVLLIRSEIKLTDSSPRLSMRSLGP